MKQNSGQWYQVFLIASLVLPMIFAHAGVKDSPQCQAPSDIVFTPIINQEYPFGYDLKFSWSGPEGVQYEWKLTNGSPIAGTTTAAAVTITSIEAGISVVFAVRTRCADNTTSEWITQGFNVPSAFCPEPQNVVIVPTATSFSMSWTYPIKPYLGFEYIVERVDDGTLVAMDVTETPFFEAGGLEPDTEYKIILNVWCDPAASGPGNVTVFTVRTTGIPCISKGITSAQHYIDLVQLNTLHRVSGNDNGYASTGVGTTLQTGGHYNLLVSAGGGEALRFVNVWIDYNMDGDFYDAHERVANRAFKYGDVTASIVVPKFASAGSTTMRVMIQPHPTSGKSMKTEPCGTYPFGETEDYRITFENAQTGDSRTTEKTSSALTVFPNPVTDILHIKGIDAMNRIVITDRSGNVVYEGSAQEQLNVSGWRPGFYYLKTMGDKNGITIRFVKK
jgi:hypothetical protein